MNIQVLLKSIAARIKSARLARRLTMADVATKTGISKKTYERIEAAEDFVAIKHYLKACIFFDIDFEKQVNGTLELMRKRVRNKPTITKDEVNF